MKLDVVCDLCKKKFGQMKSPWKKDPKFDGSVGDWKHYCMGCLGGKT